LICFIIGSERQEQSRQQQQQKQGNCSYSPGSSSARSWLSILATQPAIEALPTRSYVLAEIAARAKRKFALQNSYK
jgi:hypothetical protein